MGTSFFPCLHINNLSLNHSMTTGINLEYFKLNNIFFSGKTGVCIEGMSSSLIYLKIAHLTFAVFKLYIIIYDPKI